MSTTSHRIGSTVRWSVYQKTVVAISRTRNFECFDNYASNLHSDVDLIEAATNYTLTYSTSRSSSVFSISSLVAAAIIVIIIVSLTVTCFMSDLTTFFISSKTDLDMSPL